MTGRLLIYVHQAKFILMTGNLHELHFLGHYSYLSLHILLKQEEYIRAWLSKRIDFPANFGIIFYPGRYDDAFKSIIPAGTGDVASLIPHSDADVAVLEEPEHLNWFNSGHRWIDSFCHVVGVCHTNYISYARHESGEANAKLLERVNLWCVQMHCHKVIKLSDAVQPLPRSVTCFVHGVSSKFIDQGDAAAEGGASYFSKGAYFIGKAVWGKGYRELLQLMSHDKAQAEATEGQVQPLHLNVYGSGEDLGVIKEGAASRNLDCIFHGSRDHLDPELHHYKCFINPSLSDVVATTSAEALAMGKWIVVPDHPENEFFRSFRNCLIYKTPDDFVACVKRAIAEAPHPLNAEERERLTWEAATERFLDMAEIKKGEWPPSVLTDQVAGLSYSIAVDTLKTVQKGIRLGGTVGGRFKKVWSKDGLKQMGNKVPSAGQLNTT
jgi:digalactosyldiacylglycerol synthase